MSEKLKPCPRCGPKGKAVIEQDAIMYDAIMYYVICEKCGLQTLWHITKKKAAENWNTRPLEDALQARIDALEAEAGIRDWECLSCGWTYRGKDQCPKCGDTAHPLTTAREIAQKARIAALEAVLDEIRLIARSVLPSEEVISDHQAHWNGNELYQIAKKAESALEGEAQK